MESPGGSDEGIGFLSARQLIERVRAGSLSARQVAEACLGRVEALDQACGAFIAVLHDAALEQATATDAAPAQAALPLRGLPVAVKDVFSTPGTVTTVGQRSLVDFMPDLPEARCVTLLRAAGATVVGRTSVGSGLHPPDVEAARLPPARNPWAPDRTPGGSSSGSAVALLAGMSCVTLGTDVAGSVRIPASFSGVVGLKPTHGLVSPAGNLYGAGSAFDEVGPLARCVDDVRLVMEVLAEPAGDPRADGAAAHPPPSWERTSDGVGLRVAVAAGGGPLGAAPDVQARLDEAATALRHAGAQVASVNLPVADNGVFQALMLLDAWSDYADLVPPPDEYARYRRGILDRTARSATKYLEGLATPLRLRYDSLLQSHDAVLLATAPITAPRLGELSVPWGGAEYSTFELQSAHTWMFNLTGHPALSVPWGFDGDGLPVGLQLVGRHFEDTVLLDLAELLEEQRGPLPIPAIAVV